MQARTSTKWLFWQACKWILVVLLVYQLWIFLHILVWIKFNPDRQAHL